MNPGWTIISVIVGALLGFWGAIGLEMFKRNRLREEFKESVLTELKEILPDLVYITIRISSTNELKEWGKELLNKLKDTTINERKEQVTKWIDDIDNLEQSTGIPSPLYLSLLNENIISLSLLDKKSRSYILRIRYNINFINTQADYCLSYSQTNSEDKEALIYNNLKAIASYSGNTAKLIEKLVFKKSKS